MRHRALPLLVVAALLVALPAAAEVYTIKLSNGATFESRYQPKQATWDPTQVMFIDETGTEISLPQSLIADIVPQSELKGFGRVLDTTTIDLGFMPNDLDESQALMQQQAEQAGFAQIFDQPESSGFLEPNEPGVGVGIPYGFVNTGGGFGAGGPVAFGAGPVGGPRGGTPAPFTTPTNTATPAPFTIPTPASATPTSPQ